MKKRIRNFMVCMILISTLIFSNMFVMTSEAATTSTGWKHNNIGWWYVTNKSGSYYKNTWQKINGKWYYFKKDGYMAASEYWGGYWVNPNGSWTYVPKATWKKNTTGWWYGDTAGWFAKGKTYEINGVKYHFNSRGYWGADWEKNGNYWYYIDQNGNKITNSIMTINKVKYFFDKTGKMVTNSFITTNGHKYFFKSNGAMAVNSWITSNSNKYYTNDNGYIVTGLQTINSNKYYFDKNGVMQKNTEVTINNVTYTIDKNGICTEKKDDPVDPDPVQPGTEDPVDPDPVDPVDPDPVDPVDPIDPVHTHTMKSEVVKPTCTEQGYTKHWCTTCTETFDNDNFVKPLGHDYITKYFEDEACTIEITKEDLSCNEVYYIQTSCSRCTFNEVTKHEAGEHTFRKLDSSKEATCKEYGHLDQKCEVCGFECSNELEPVDHIYGDWTEKTHGTCTEIGTEHRYCTVCEEEEVRNTTKDPNNHKYVTISKVYVDYNYVATTCDPNIETYWEEECEWCGNVIRHDVEHLNHNFSGETKYFVDENCTVEAPEQLDCETTYYYKTKCINCDTWSDVKVKEAGQHNWIDDTSKEDIKSTCHTHGTHYKKCSICGKQDEDELELDPNNHEGEEVSDNNEVAATCQDKGKTASTHCSVCGNTIKSQTDTPINPNNHIGELVTDAAVAATCQHTGLTAGSHWSGCGCIEVEQKETPIDPTNHEHAYVTKVANIKYYIEMPDGTIVEDTAESFYDRTNSKYYRYHGKDNRNYEIEEGWGYHWDIYDNKETKYYVEDYESYSSFDISWYWWKNFGKILDPNDYTTWLIPENPLVIAQAEIEGITPEQLVEKFTDYMENPRTLHSYPYNTVRSLTCQDENSAMWVKDLCQPASTGCGEAWIYKGTLYEVTSYKIWCPDEECYVGETAATTEKLWDAETVVGYTLPYGN